ncbi:MAG: DPP IV N-terminal domain-containing protein [Pseudomonadota bacterium]
MAILPAVSLAQDKWTPELSIHVKRLSDLSFAPNGQQLLYGVNSVDLANDRHLTSFLLSDLEGNSVRTLLPPTAGVSSAQWSPDGRQVAYLSSQSGHNNLWIVSSEGGQSSQLSDLKQDISSFRWAPDGKAIGFVMPDPAFEPPPVQNPEVFNRDHLWLLPVSDGKPAGPIVNLTEEQGFTVSTWAGNWAYDWSPDSTRIVFAH